MPQLPHATTASLLISRADDDAPGLRFEDTTWSWREVVAEAAVRAAVLTELRPDDRPWHVGVLADNVPDYLFLIAGAALSGATLVGVNPTRRGEELAADIRGVDIDTLVVDPAYGHLLEGIDHGARQVLTLPGQETSAYEDLLTNHAGAHPAILDRAADPTTQLMLLFTSGSTGAPKAVICSTGRMAVLAQVNPMVQGRDDVAYNAMPLFHGNAVMASWATTLLHGATFAMRRRFSASGFLPDVQRFGATYFNYVGRSLSYVLAQPERRDEREHRLRYGFGTEASPRDRAEFERRFGCPVIESYGSSEGVVSIRRTEGTPEGALGLPPPETPAAVLADDGHECPPAEFTADGQLSNAEEAIGEIVALGAAQRFEGYYGNPEATAEKVRDNDVWTGDLAYRDREGWFWFAGRTADWLRVDSENFAAAPVERILARHPAVAVAVVYPVPDPRTGDRVMACLQPVEGADLDPDSLASFLAAQPDLGTKWTPAYLRVTSELPVTATRKVDKTTLRRVQWEVDEPVWELTATGYTRLEEARRDELRHEFGLHGRSALLPQRPSTPAPHE